MSGSDDKLVCHFDINASARGANNTVPAVQVFSGHKDVVEDVAWHYHNSNLVGSCGDDKQIIIWDTRTKAKPHLQFEAHKAEINCISFNPHNDYNFVSGSSDRTVALWDMRNVKARVHSFESHGGHIFAVSWAPFAENILASASGDRRVNVWDLSRIGTEQDPEDAEDGPPELLFIHGGHTDRVTIL